MLWTALHHHGPVFIRYPRGGGEGSPQAAAGAAADRQGQGGTARTDVALLYYGAVAPLVQERRRRWSRGVSVAIIKPGSANRRSRLIEQYARQTRVLATIENHVLMAGSAAPCSRRSRNADPDRVARIGWPDKFIEHASTNRYSRRNTAERRGRVTGSRPCWRASPRRVRPPELSASPPAPRPNRLVQIPVPGRPGEGDRPCRTSRLRPTCLHRWSSSPPRRIETTGRYDIVGE